MQKILKAALPLALAVGVSGCAGINTRTSEQTMQIQAETNYFGNGMLTALRQGGYSDFTRDFSKELRESIPETVFYKLTDDLISKQETVSQWKHLDSLDRGGIYKTEVWKVVLVKQTKNGKTNVERLFYVTTAKLDGKPQVIGFKFDPLF